MSQLRLRVTVPEATSCRHILLTGGSSGIGLAAAQRLLRTGQRLTLPCRDHETAATLQRRLGEAVRTPVCDLADLDSVERCADALRQAAEPIDTLVLNAGLQYSGCRQPRWSAQGFELTVAVNHLGHQALLQRLLPLLLRGRSPRLVVTSSEVHDPAAPGGRVGRPAGLGDLDGLCSGPGSPMLAGGECFDADKAYKDSKLCNLLMAQELERRLRRQGRELPVLAWSPGLVIARGEGGFFRESRRLNPLGQALFALLARDLLRLTETVEGAGGHLADLAAGPLPGPEGFQYWSNRVLAPGRLRFEACQPSVEAGDEALAERLWTLTAHAIGLDPQTGLDAPG